MGLHDLGQVHHPPEQGGDWRDAYPEHLVAGLGRGDEVADGADPAYARHERRHFVHRAPLGDAFEASHLGDVEAGISHLPGVVELHRYLGVALDAGHRFYDYLAHLCLPDVGQAGPTTPGPTTPRLTNTRPGQERVSQSGPPLPPPVVALPPGPFPHRRSSQPVEGSPGRTRPQARSQARAAPQAAALAPPRWAPGRTTRRPPGRPPPGPGRG